MVISSYIITVCQNGVLSNLKTVFLLSYGCDLDHNNIDYLVKERLKPFARCEGNILNKKVSRHPEILLMYDVYDVNLNKPVDNKYYLEEFLINEAHFQAFEYSLSKLKGHHIQCRPFARGHYELSINGKKYSTRVYQTVANDKELFFFDQEAIHNTRLREKNHELPIDLQWLILSKDIDQTERETAIFNWINEVLNFIGQMKIKQ